MAKITFEEPDGKERTVDMANGQSIMEGAVKAMVAGIDADCGGACSCATCMVYVAAEWQDRLPAKQSAEEQMLEFCPHVQDNSRLTCQIPVTDALDGLMVKVPPSQH
jgi:ferredoxin, 2Fe-2S